MAQQVIAAAFKYGMDHGQDDFTNLRIVEKSIDWKIISQELSLHFLPSRLLGKTDAWSVDKAVSDIYCCNFVPAI